MGRFVNSLTGVVVTVDDSKDDRYAAEPWSPEKAKPKPAKAPAKPADK